MICNFCKKNNSLDQYQLIVNNKTLRVFCSQICLDKYKSKYHYGVKKSIITRQKIAIANSKPHTDERKRNISIARKKRLNLTSEQKSIAYEMLMIPYYSLRLISETIECNISRLKEYNNECSITNIKIRKANEIRIFRKHKKSMCGKLFNSKEMLDWYYTNITKMTRKDVKTKLGFIMFEPWCLKYFGKTYKPTKYEFHKGPTSPELKFRDFLIENSIQYKYNEPALVCDLNGNFVTYSVDFVVNDIIYIEIQGDYWHANPLLYPDSTKLNGVQRSNINRDRRKKAQILCDNPKIKYFKIWENDINKQTDVYKKITKEIIKEISCMDQNQK